MNTTRRYAHYIFQRCYRSCSLLIRANTKNTWLSLPLKGKVFLRFGISSSVLTHSKLTVEDDLRKACEANEAAILDLMNQLKELVIELSQEYRTCLTNQIELVKNATIIGPEAWDELPKYRTLANELSNELYSYIILFKTIGEVAYDQTLISFSINKDSLDYVCKKYKELEIILLKEFEENKKMELELLESNLDNIMSDYKYQ